MIVAIEGEVVRKEPTFVHIKTSGLTYQVFVSLNCSAKIDTKNISLHIAQIIKEDSNLLYGFLDTAEKTMFNKLIKINGIGASTAMAICSTFTPSAFSSAIAAGDVAAIKSVPGIGPKSAKRILVELSDFAIEETSYRQNSSLNEAMMALESLGFKKEKIQKVLKECKSSDTPSLVKEALKRLR